MPGHHALVVVANRLPVDRRQAPDGSTSWQPSPGGLVAALEPVMRRNEGAWIGWTGAPGEAPEEFDAQGMHLVPVPLDEQEVEEFYEGMSNGTLWPLYHDVIAPPRFHRRWWDAYVTVNRRFAHEAAGQAAHGATVWVQDYQLQLVPRMLREERPDLRIGFFNHIPFPPYEIYAQLPWRRQILEGLLGADLLGFQRPADANNLLRACRRSGMSTRRGTVRVPGRGGERLVRCGSFPISVDAQTLDEIARKPEVVARAKEIRAELGDPELVLLGVDRLDYTKGILHRLKAVQELYADGRLRTPGTVLVQVATPTRGGVEAYQDLRNEVEVTVGRINGEYGQLGKPAVHYLHQSFRREELAAMYLAADVLLVTSLRDGMNLVAKEYIVSRHDERGALVLSEFTGAAIELPQAYLVNPHDIDGLKDAVVRAATASPKESERRMRAMRRHVFTHDVGKWASDFLSALAHPERAAPGLQTEPPTALASQDVDDAVLTALAGRPQLLVAVDFDGTLAPIVENPDAARALPASASALHRLSGAPGTVVAFVSGRSVADLRAVAAPPDGALLIGGHGAEFTADGAVSPVLTPEQADLLRRVGEALQAIADRSPGTHVEHKPTSAVLHTRRAGRDVADAATREALDGPAQWSGVQPTRGKEVVELSVVEVTKGTALADLRERLGLPPGAVVYLGDDVTDERAFAALDQDGGDVAVKVGDGDSVARRRVAGPEQVAALLARLADLREQSRSGATGSADPGEPGQAIAATDD